MNLTKLKEKLFLAEKVNAFFVSFALVKIRFIFMNRLELTDPLSEHNSVIILFCIGIVSLILINELFMV